MVNETVTETEDNIFFKSTIAIHSLNNCMYIAIMPAKIYFGEFLKNNVSIFKSDFVNSLIFMMVFIIILKLKPHLLFVK